LKPSYITVEKEEKIETSIIERKKRNLFTYMQSSMD